jgi:transcriptional regulator with XRE-family HTH domain
MASGRLRTKSATFAAEFGARLRAARDRRGMTQQQLASEIGTYAPRISQYEGGAVVPEGETLAAIAEALDVSLDELVLGRPREQPDDVRDVRLRASVRELEGLEDRRFVDAALMVIDAFVVQAQHEATHARVIKRRRE